MVSLKFFVAGTEIDTAQQPAKGRQLRVRFKKKVQKEGTARGSLEWCTASLLRATELELSGGKLTPVEGEEGMTQLVPKNREKVAENHCSGVDGQTGLGLRRAVPKT